MDHLLIGIIVFSAAFTQGVVGFAFGLVSMAFLPMVLPELVAIPFVAVYACAVAAMIAWQTRADLSWPRVGPLLIGLVAGVPLGLAFLSEVDPTWVRLSLGVFLVLYSLWAIFIVPRMKQLEIRDAWSLVAGLFSGVLGGAFNTGGPPLVVFATLKSWDKGATKSTLNTLFVTTGIIAIAGHAIAGRLTGDLLLQNLLYAPVVVAGVLIGGLLYDKIDHRTFRRALLAVLLMAGLVFINKSLGLV